MCFVGIGLPSTAANLARRLYADRAGAGLRVGLHRLEADAAAAVDRRRRAGRDRRRRVSACPRSSPTGCRPAASTSGSSAAPSSTSTPTSTRPSSATTTRPKTRLPGAGGAPEIAASAGAVMVIMRQSARAFVERCDFRTSIGFGDGPGDRERLGLRGGGPEAGHHRPRRAATRSRHVRAGDDARCIPASPASRWSPRPAGRCGSPTTSATTDEPTEHELDDAAGHVAGGMNIAVHLRPAAGSGSCSAPAGARRCGDEVERLGGSAGDADLRSARRKAIADELSRAARVRWSAAAWDEVAQHVPVELAERAARGGHRRRCDVRRLRSAEARRPGWPRRSR